MKISFRVDAITNPAVPKQTATTFQVYTLYDASGNINTDIVERNLTNVYITAQSASILFAGIGANSLVVGNKNVQYTFWFILQTYIPVGSYI